MKINEDEIQEISEMELFLMWLNDSDLNRIMEYSEFRERIENQNIAVYEYFE